MTEMEFLARRTFFTTREYALFLNKNISASSRKLRGYAKKGDLILVTRGIWGNKNHKDFSPYGAIPYLLANEQGYLSFLSALHRHGMISQIPTAIQIATTGRGRVLKSVIGEFQFFKIRPEMLSLGINVFEGNIIYNMASPEKALLDTFYIATKKNHRFKKLPEIEWDGFHKKLFLKLLKSYPKNSQKLILERYLRFSKSWRTYI